MMQLGISRFLFNNKYYFVGGYILIAMLLLGAIVLLHSRTFSVPSHDFMVIAWKPGQQLLNQGNVDLQYPYPLWTLILMLPLVLWTPEVGAQLWFVCNLLFLAASIVIMMRLLKWPVRISTVALTCLLLISYSPVFTGLWLGQLIFVSLLALVGLARALQNDSWTEAGVILAFSLIKPQVTILLAAAIFGVAIRQRQWKIFAGFGAVLLIFIAISAPFATTARQVLGGGIKEHLIEYIARTSTLWGLTLTLLPGSLLLAAALSAMLFAWVVYIWVDAFVKGEWMERLMYLFSITTLVNLLIVPYSWSYNHALLVFPLCYAVDQTRLLQRTARLIWLIALLALFYPVSMSIHTNLTVVYRSDVYQIIPVLCLLPLVVALQWHARWQSRHVGQDAEIASISALTPK